LVAGLTGSAAPSAAASNDTSVADSYTLELLDPTNDGVASSALGINDVGDVSGITRLSSSAQPQQTVLWERHGDHFDAHELANLDNSRFSRGFDVSDARTVVGEAFDSAGRSIPIRWEEDAAPQHVTTLNEAGTGILNDISNDGVAVGTASARGVMMSSTGEVSVLAAPDPDSEGATVNSYTATTVAGSQAVGGRASISYPHGDHSHTSLVGVVWDEYGTRLLDTPEGGTAPVVAGITPEGRTVGSATIATKETPVEWDAAGAPRVLPTPAIADYTHAAAKSTSEDVIVGYASKFAGNTSFGGTAVAWDDQGAVDLNALVSDLPEGVTLQAANDINASGQIVGQATTPSGQRGFVLTPEAPDEPVSTAVSAEAVKQVYGRVAELEVTVEPNAAGEVSVDTGPEVLTTELVNGEATVPLPARLLAPGRHTLAITYPGMIGEFSPSEGIVPVRVVRARPSVRITPVKAEVRRGANAVFRAVVDAVGVKPSGRVSVKVAGKARTVRLAPSGRATIKVPLSKHAKPGVKKAVASYSGDAYVRKALSATRIRVTR
jgi:hypothetical protein